MYGGYIIKLERIGSGLNAFRIYKYMKFKNIYYFKVDKS